MEPYLDSDGPRHLRVQRQFSKVVGSAHPADHFSVLDDVDRARGEREELGLDVTWTRQHKGGKSGDLLGCLRSSIR